MKTSAILTLLLTAGSTIAAPVTAGPEVDERPFKMLVSAKGQPFEGKYLQANNYAFWIGKDTNSSCGAVTPTFIYDELLTTYGNGKQNVQIVMADIASAAGGKLSWVSSTYQYFSTNFGIQYKNFTRVQDEIFYKNGTWLACPSIPDGVYKVYPAKDYGFQLGKNECLPFSIKTEVVEGEVTPCELY